MERINLTTIKNEVLNLTSSINNIEYARKGNFKFESEELKDQYIDSQIQELKDGIKAIVSNLDEESVKVNDLKEMLFEVANSL